MKPRCICRYGLRRAVVAAATTIVEDECLHAALGATGPQARGKGYADATLRRSLHSAHAAPSSPRRFRFHVSQASTEIATP
jgi:hypothetical protein